MMKEFNSQFSVLLLIGSLNMCFYSSGTQVCNTAVSLTKRKLAANNLTTSPDLTFTVILQENVSCYVELDSVISHTLSYMENRANLSVVYCQLQFFCSNQIVVRFNTTRGIQKTQNLKILLDLNECSVHVEDLNLFSLTGSLISLKQYSVNTMILAETETECLFAETLNLLESYIGYRKLSSGTQGLFFWEKCKEIFKNMKAIVLSGRENKSDSWSYTGLEEKFPSLNTLIVRYINLQMPVTFKWNRSPEKHTCTMSLDISNHDFPSRYLPVPAFSAKASNDLSDIHLQGNLTMVQLDNMTTTGISGTFFENVQGVKKIVMHGNALHTIDERLFQNTTCLRILILRSNHISYLHEATFRSLDLLYQLSLADNKLKYVSSKLFEPLVSLQELHLEKNHISHLPLYIFSKQLMLQKLYIYDNPLVDIPFFAIYLPYIKLIDCHQTKISDSSFIALTKKYSGKINDADLDIPGLNKDLGPRTKNFDLSNCNITNFYIPTYGKIGRSVFVYIFYTYNVVTFGNLFECYCDVAFLQGILRALNVSGITSDVVCHSPPEFFQRPLVTIEDDELYCPEIFPDCPRICSCYQRTNGLDIIVDCRNANISDLPQVMPDGNALELWFKNASLVKIEPRSYLINVVGLDVTNNSIDFIDPEAISSLRNARYIYLDSNEIRYIPEQIRKLNMTHLTLRGNPLLCDCRTLWMKRWILEKRNVLKDWTDIKCVDMNSNIKQVIAVPDDLFFCRQPVAVSLTEKIFLPLTVSGSCLFTLITVSILIYCQRFNLKVLLYIKFGIDPCNKPKNDRRRYEYDVFVVFCPQEAVLAQDEIAKHLLQKNYKIALFEKDFVIGYSVIENVEKLLKLSRRVIFVFSEKTMQNPTYRIVWNLAYERARDISMKDIILIADKNLKRHCSDDSVLKFLNNNRFIQIHSKLMKESVEYMMPRRRVRDYIEMFQRHLLPSPGSRRSVSVLTHYPIITRYYIRHEFKPYLLDKGFELKEVDMEFVPGTDIRDEIFEVLDRAEHFIYILSEETLLDEVLMFILCEAVTKSMLCDYNYLLPAVKGQLDIDALPTKVQNYIEHYTIIEFNSDNFKQRILEALKHGKVQEEIDSDDEDDINRGPLS